MNSQPTQISRYEIKGLIAQGGMGDLYLARDPNTDRLVALKLLLATLDSSDIRGRFEREARALASLNHPNVVHIYDYGDFQGAPFIVMEYVRGETLAEKIKRHAPMPVSEKLRLMVELCAGLTHAHQAGIIHRDVKPANLLVDQDEHLKILDFGIARVGGSNLTTVGTLGTLMNMQIGTPGYMSPEQIEGGEIDHRTDVFAAGAVCYELLSNREAFSGGNSAEIESHVLTGQPLPLASLVPGVDPELDAIIMRALAKHRDQRYQSASLLGEALEGCRSRLGWAKTSPAPRRQIVLPPSGGGMSRGEAAYQRAVDLYEDGAREAARRFACEALAEDSNHAGARTLLGRLDKNRQLPGMRAGTPFNPSLSASLPSSPDPPTAVSEPTVFLAPIDATVLIPRPDDKTVSTATDATVFIPPAKRPLPTPRDDETARVNQSDRSVRSAVAEPTVLVKPPEPAQPSPPAGYIGVLAGLQSRWTRWRTRWKRRPSSQTARHSRGRPGPSWKGYKRSALIAAALVLMMAGAVLIAMVISRWSSGHLLTITTPVGGTISSAGIRCGTRGSDCSTTHREGDAVELSAEPDEGFSFSGFTGDCAPTGRIAMTGSRTCSATFERTVLTAPPVLWPLTIKPPTGGTILAAGGIECGSFGTGCATNLPDGVPVTLIARADHGYTFLTFTDECAPTGNTMMTGPRTCGATFIAANPQAPSPPPPPPIKRTQKPPVVGDLPVQTAAPAAAPPAAPAGEAPSNEQIKVATGDKVQPPISREEHSKNEIQGIIKEYCAALEAMDPSRIRKIFPSTNESTLRDRYRQYKSAKCALTTPPEFVLLDADAGTAQVKVGVKQTQEMKSGGAPKISETIASVTLLRPGLRTPWHIGNVLHEAKPKE